MENTWFLVNPDYFANQLSKAGLTIVHLEFFAMRWSWDGSEGPLVGRTEKLKRFVRAMRAKGIWTFINVVNFNYPHIGRSEYNAKWFRRWIKWFQNNIGNELVILQPVSEWADHRNLEYTAKARAWHKIGMEEWHGLLSHNKGSRPQGLGGLGDYFEYHPNKVSDTGTGKWCIVVTDTGRILEYYQGELYGQRVKRIGELESHVKRTLRAGRGFIYYGFYHETPDLEAIKAIGRAAKQVR